MNLPTKFTIDSGPVAGFVAEAAAPGAKFSIVTRASETSDTHIFHVWMKNISELFLLRAPIPVDLVHAFLIVLHEDNTADIYI